MPSVESNPAVVVPIKGFDHAKLRLGAQLDESQRRTLAMAMARRLVAAAAPLPVLVACDDAAVAEWAAAQGAETLWVPANGLNAAVTAAVAQVADLGYTTAVVAHSDLPLAERLDHLIDSMATEVVLVPDRRADGTNVVVTPTHRPLEFAYGDGSFHRHIHAAVAAGHPLRVVSDADLGWDVDEPADLELANGHSVLDWLSSRETCLS